MSEFLIRYDPPIPEAKAIDPPLVLLDAINVEKVLNTYTQEHGITYSVGGRAFSYYPSSILTVMNDIHLEWMLLREGQSHDVTLAGYTVLQAIFEESEVQFYNPALQAPDWRPRPVGSKYDPAYLEETFRAASATVWGFIRTLNDPHG